MGRPFAGDDAAMGERFTPRLQTPSTTAHMARATTPEKSRFRSRAKSKIVRYMSESAMPPSSPASIVMIS